MDISKDDFQVHKRIVESGGGGGVREEVLGKGLAHCKPCSSKSTNRFDKEPSFTTNQCRAVVISVVISSVVAVSFVNSAVLWWLQD